MASSSTPLTEKSLAAHSSLYPTETVYDIPQSACILAHLPGPAGSHLDECIRVRWSAISCRPAQFVDKGYVLRASLFGTRRRTRLLVSIFISSTDTEEAVRGTLDAVICNVAALDASTSPSQRIPWREVVVLLIGCTYTSAMTRETVELLHRLGLFLPPVLDPGFGGWAGQVYEYTTFLRPRAADEEPTPCPVPCQLVFFNSNVSFAPDEANMWAVRAFANALEAETWIPLELDRSLGLTVTAFCEAIGELGRDPVRVVIAVQGDGPLDVPHPPADNETAVKQPANSEQSERQGQPEIQDQPEEQRPSGSKVEVDIKGAAIRAAGEARTGIHAYRLVSLPPSDYVWMIDSSGRRILDAEG
ncbi:hypothetical protein GQ53DRAFT_835828 [Thozetella sp. PMI_491]|nr:hypothetical protein GQ53DRAFT_835828 [Thozetella sp. PMI_491]